jgi:TRAP-type C4-dicarboxylate transport system permease small subunit
MQNRDSTVGKIKEEAERISQSARGWIIPLARFGYAAKGVVYLIIGGLAALAAFTRGGRTTDSRGAFEEILSQSYGKLLLGAVAVGMAAYAIWRIVQAVKDTENKGSDAKGIARRIGYAAIGVIHIGLAYSAAQLIFGSGGESRGDAASKEWTATLLAQPFGQWLVGAVGLGFIAFAVSQFYKAFTAKFREKLKTNEMDEKTQTFATRSGQAGLSARGVVFGIVGVFLIQAALHSNAGEARGLSGALRALEQQSYGQWVLGIVALGLIAYGLYMLVLARYRRIII